MRKGAGTGLHIQRGENEHIDIGPDIRVTVTRITGKRVYLTINAPKNFRVTRPDYAPNPHGKDQQLDTVAILLQESKRRLGG